MNITKAVEREPSARGSVITTTYNGTNQEKALDPRPVWILRRHYDTESPNWIYDK
jgi:hypothetical protein